LIFAELLSGTTINMPPVRRTSETYKHAPNMTSRWPKFFEVWLAPAVQLVVS
jgi:hypothetical protein